MSDDSEFQTCKGLIHLSHVIGVSIHAAIPSKLVREVLQSSKKAKIKGAIYIT